MAMRIMTSLLAASVCLLPVACADRTLDETGDEAGPDGPEPGDQPQAAGAMYSPCQVSPDCPDGLCVFPSGEAGFCSAPCAAPDDPGNCAPPPGDQTPSCLDIRLPTGSPVCALDCADAPCPRGMRCEQVLDGDDSERAICF